MSVHTDDVTDWYPRAGPMRDEHLNGQLRTGGRIVRKWLLVFIVASGVLCGPVLLDGFAAEAPYRTANFATDPHWEGVGNRPTSGSPACAIRRFDFGWSDTANAGGAAGEIGGTLPRSSRYRAYYAVALNQAEDLGDVLSASGKLIVPRPAGGALLFGWFNAGASIDFRTPDYLGLRLSGDSAGWNGLADLGTRGNLATGIKDPSLRFNYNQVYSWSVTYDPNGGSQGVGLITLQIGGHTATRSLTPELRADGATFDHFGFLNVMIDGGPLRAYVDHLDLNDQSFEFDTDPGWDSLNNRTTLTDCYVHTRDDFGFSDTAFAGGNRGEIGGAIWRADSQVAGLNAKVSSYADRLPSLTANDGLYAEGSIVTLHASSDSDMFIGWFNGSSRISRIVGSDGAVAYTGPDNMLGAVLGGPSADGYRFTPYYVGDDPRSAAGFSRFASGPSLLPRGRARKFWICYEPNADAAGDGLLTTGLSGVPALGLPEVRSDLVISKAKKDAGVDLNRFGIRNFQVGGHDMVVYFDDLRYTVGPGDSGPAGHCGLDTTAPTGSISWPVNGAVVGGRSVWLNAVASDNSAVSRVQFNIDGSDVGKADSVAPYSLKWRSAAVGDGTHAVSADVTDTSGNRFTTAAIDLVVDHTPPMVSLRRPRNDSRVSGRVTIQASAVDNHGLAWIQLSVDGHALKDKDRTSPYLWSWESRTVRYGRHSLRAIARDRAGNVAVSPVVHVIAGT